MIRPPAAIRSPKRSFKFILYAKDPRKYGQRPFKGTVRGRAFEKVGVWVSVVVTLTGTNEEVGERVLRGSGVGVEVVRELEQTARRIVELAGLNRLSAQYYRGSRRGYMCCFGGDAWFVPLSLLPHSRACNLARVECAHSFLPPETPNLA